MCTTGSDHLHFKEAALQSLLHKDVAQLLLYYSAKCRLAASVVKWHRLGH